MNEEPSHFAYSDESHPNVGRYRGIALVTLGSESLVDVIGEVRQRLDDSDVQEFKWEKLRNAKHRFAAHKLLEYTVSSAAQAMLRVDALTWDTEDGRHKIVRRDDAANLQRMYYHLFKNVLGERWPDGMTWHLLPDENSAIDWRKVRHYLDRPIARLEAEEIQSTWYDFGTQLREKYRVRAISECESHKEPLIQLADLFAGLAVFSRAQYDSFEEWCTENDPQTRLLPEETPCDAGRRSLSEKERFFVLDAFDKLCKNRRLGVSLKTCRGLRTFDPGRPINFWWYETQHLHDKAPQKR